MFGNGYKKELESKNAALSQENESLKAQIKQLQVRRANKTRQNRKPKRSSC